MDGTNGSNQPIGTNMIQTGPFADSAAVAAAAAAAAAAAQRTQLSSSSAPGGVLPPPDTTRHSALSVPPSTPLSPPPILQSRGLSPGALLSATVGGGGAGFGDPNDSSSTLGTANLSAVQQPVLSLTGVTFGGGSHRVVQPRQLPMGGPNGSPPGSSPESVGAGQGGGWRQMQRQQHDYQFGPRGGTMNTNPSAPPSKRRRTMMEAFGDMSLSRRRGMAGLDLATLPGGTVGGTSSSSSSSSRPGLGDGAAMASSSTRSLGDFAFNASSNTTTNRPSRPSPIAGLTGVGPMQHIGFSSVASHSSPGQMRRSVGTRGSSGNGATPSEETIEDDSDDPLDVSPYNKIAAPTALPPKPDSNVIRITSSDMESASETASEMDEGVLDVFPPLAIAASSTADKPKNPVDAKIEELIRRDRMRAMIQAKLEAEGKKPANGSSEVKTRDDFDYQGTFTTAGSTTWRKLDAVMGDMPAASATQVGADASVTPISIPAAIAPHHPASTAGTVLPSAAASAAAIAASAAMPPPAPVAANISNPNRGDAKVAPGMLRGRSTERRSSRGSRSRSLPRQYMKMAPQPSKSRNVSMASASSAATSGGGDASDMDL